MFQAFGTKTSIPLKILETFEWKLGFPQDFVKMTLVANQMIITIQLTIYSSISQTSAKSQVGKNHGPNHLELNDLVVECRIVECLPLKIDSKPSEMLLKFVPNYKQKIKTSIQLSHKLTTPHLGTLMPSSIQHNNNNSVKL